MVSEELTAAPRPGASLRDLIWGFTISQALYVAAKLAVVDLLWDGAKTSREIAAAVGAHEPALGRLLRALTTVAVLVEDDQGRFAATALGEQLRSDHPQSARAMAIMLGAPFVWRPWGELDAAVLTGTPAFDQVYGESFYEYLGRRPEAAAIFNAAMSSGSRNDLPAILAAYDFSGCTKIVDVGGGQGALLRGILEQYPHATGVLCDLPSVLAEAHDFRNSAVAERCEFVATDMFQSLPGGGDAYLLKAILHNWNDAQALQILRNCRQAIADQGKLLHIGAVLKPSNEADFGKWLDLNLLVVVPGRERTEAEFRDLYMAAGFQLTRVIPTSGPTIVEGIPV
jgi:hypothetical protein